MSETHEYTVTWGPGREVKVKAPNMDAAAVAAAPLLTANHPLGVNPVVRLRVNVPQYGAHRDIDVRRRTKTIFEWGL